jgi:hypothetical protein
VKNVRGTEESKIVLDATRVQNVSNRPADLDQNGSIPILFSGEEFISEGRDDGDRFSILSGGSDFSSDSVENYKHFVEVASLSAASRRTAAPFIHNIYEQV